MSAQTELPADPGSIKKLEKEISLEAKAEEKKLQAAYKDMYKQERSEAKASKHVEKAEKAVKKLEKQELETVKSLHAATHKHDEAVAGLHHAEADLHTHQQQLEMLRRDLSTMRQHADQVTNEKRNHDRERDNRLSQLYSSPPKVGGPTTSTSGASTGASQERSL